jgi:hypothetical protein
MSAFIAALTDAASPLDPRHGAGDPDPRSTIK